MGNLGGDRMQTLINEVLAVFQLKKARDMLTAPFWNERQWSINDF